MKITASFSRLPVFSGVAASLAALTLTLAGCSGGDAATAHEGAGSAASAGSAESPGEPVSTGSAEATEEPSAPEPRFGMPEGWVELKPSGSMRHKEFRFEGENGSLELVVFRWGTGMGGVEKNVDNWLGTGRKASSLTPKERQEFSSGPFASTALFLDGGAPPAHGAGGDTPEGGGRFYAYIECDNSSTVWTIKCTGPGAAMEAQRPAFESLLSSL